MTNSNYNWLIQGRKYYVKFRGQNRHILRIFKWTEKRFDEIPCSVFTSRVSKDVTCEVTKDSLILSGKRTPKSEVSIPYYDLISCKEGRS